MRSKQFSQTTSLTARHDLHPHFPCQTIYDHQAAAAGIRVREFTATPSYQICRYCAYNQMDLPQHRHPGVTLWKPDVYPLTDTVSTRLVHKALEIK